MPRSFCLLMLAACGASVGTPTVADCEALSAGKAADECWVSAAPELFRKDPKRGVSTVESKVSDPLVRDFIWLTVTREVDPSSYQYCDRIQEKTLEDRCRVLVGRPHLHRELMKEQAGEGPPPRGGGVGPPPGGAAEGGPPPPQGGPSAPPSATSPVTPSTERPPTENPPTESP